MIRPNPWQAVQAPSGELKAKRGGVGSRKSAPHFGQWSPRRNVRVPASVRASNEPDIENAASAADAKEVLAEVRDMAGTPGEAHFLDRNLPPPYPDCVLGYQQDARPGEGAIVVSLTSRGRQLLKAEAATWRRYANAVVRVLEAT